MYSITMYMGSEREREREWRSSNFSKSHLCLKLRSFCLFLRVCVCCVCCEVLTFYGADSEKGDEVGVLQVGQLVNFIVHQSQLVLCCSFCRHTESE